MKPLFYPIRAVSNLTGVSIDTLRAWERRYQVVTPQRDERGRVYTERDIERLRLLRMAVEGGHSIGRVATLSNEELHTRLGPLAAPTGNATEVAVSVAEHPVSISHSLVSAIGRLDYGEAERELSLAAAGLGPRELVYRVALPLMRKVGEDWHRGQLSIAQEHMASALLRNLLGAIIPLYRRSSPTSHILLATPAGESHEFGILFSAILAVGGGLSIVYLGPNLPAEEIINAAKRTAPQAVVLGFIGADGGKTGLREVHEVAEHLPTEIEIWVGGLQTTALIKQVRKTRAILMEDFEMLELHLIRLGARY